MMRAAPISFALLLVAACASPPREPPHEPFSLEPPSECDQATDPLHPLVVEWPATTRAELEAAAARGPVVVSYAGCVLKVLARCRAPGTYDDAPVTPTEKEIEIRSEPELRSALPLGASRLRNALTRGDRLALTYATSTSSQLRAPPAALEGECEGATHYVEAMARGTFSLAVRARAGDVVGERTEVLDASAGERSIVGLSLRPLTRVGTRPVAAGFGAGASAPLELPVVGPIAIAPSNGDDVTVLEMLQAALRADRDERLASTAKADAWDRVARMRSRYSSLAEQRRGQWQKHAAALRAREDQVVALCPQFRTDRSKLDRLIQLDRGILGEREKELYRAEFKNVYSPWPELSRCAELEHEAAVRAAWPALHGANDGMVHIRGGTFVMGSATPSDEAMPPHPVKVEDFEIDATEITVDAYSRCERAGACTARQSDFGDDGWRCNAGRGKNEAQADAPANCMTFGQAAAYCHWAKKRLPTEEEWEYAARGPESRRYPWGEWGHVHDNEPYFPFHYCALPGSDIGYQAGSLATNASPFGVRDMAGSVWEWTSGHFNARERTLRGGEFGWSRVDASCMPYPAAYRFHHDPRYADSNLGARCAR